MTDQEFQDRVLRELAAIREVLEMLVQQQNGGSRGGEGGGGGPD